MQVPNQANAQGLSWHLDARRTSRIAAEFGVGQTQVQNIAKRGLEIMEEYENRNPDAKRLNKGISF